MSDPAPAADDGFTEVHRPEIVHPVGAEVARLEDRNQAIAEAAEAALALPGMPGKDEFLALAMQARMLSLSGAAPPAVRDNPYIAFHVAMVGRDLGISPSAALELIDVIETRKGPRLSLSPQLINGQIRRLGVGQILPGERTNERAVALVFDADGNQIGESEFTWEDARNAELVGPNCQPGQHDKSITRSKDGRSWKVCGCNQGYLNYPKRMLWWRAAGFAADDYFPEAGLGLYSPEELGAVVDEEGRPIDPSAVELPEGYADPAEARREAQAVAEQPADPDELWELQLRATALPEGLRAELRQRWGEANLPHPKRLVPSQLRKARAMINGYWATARKNGVDEGTQRDFVTAELAEGVTETLAMTGLWGGTPGSETPPLRTGAPDSAAEPSATGTTPADQPAATQTEAQGGESDADRAARKAAEAEWRGRAKALAQQVRDIGSALGPDMVAEVSTEVDAMHWQNVNRELADTYKVNELGAPIDYRRMLLVREILKARRAETPNPATTAREGEEPF